jgi:hypothetical protein
MYFYHRYQIEAAVKLIGGMHYTYALKGDGQQVTAPLSNAVQQQAMQAVIKCLDPSFLKLPDHIAAQIPPRPAGYEFSRELFKKKTGLAFDQLAPAEAAADLPLSFLFNAERLNRLAQQGLAGGYDLTEMLNALIDATFKSPRRSSMQKAIQVQTEHIVLTYLLASSIDEQLSFPARVVLQSTLSDLRKWLEEQVKTATDPYVKAHWQMAIDRFKAPEKAKPTLHAIPPPGAPIGCEDLY